MSHQVSRKKAAKITGWVLNVVLVGAAAVAVIAWLVWHSAIAVIVAVSGFGLVGFILSTVAMSISMMKTKYPLLPPKDD